MDNLIAQEIKDSRDGNISINIESNGCLIHFSGWKKTEENRILFVLGNEDDSAVACFELDGVEYNDFPIPEDQIDEIMKHFN